MPYSNSLSHNTSSKPNCLHCALKDMCLPLGLNREEFSLLDAAIKQTRRLKRGDYLCRSGDTFNGLFAVKAGFFKAALSSADGREQVTTFYMTGELIGLDGIGTNRYCSDVIALEDSEVCELPFARLESLAREIPLLQQHFFRVMSKELVRDQNSMLLLGSMRSEERLAAFLLNLSQRLASRGFSANDFILRMSREEIGSYLGLKLETVSRTLSKFQQSGWIVVEHKHITILNVEALQNLIEPCTHKIEIARI